MGRLDCISNKTVDQQDFSALLRGKEIDLVRSGIHRSSTGACALQVKFRQKRSILHTMTCPTANKYLNIPVSTCMHE